MTSWLLGIDRLDPSDPTVAFGWAHTVPPFVWALAVLGAVALAWVSYARQSGPGSVRTGLAVCRLLLLLLLAALLAGPRLQKPNERTEQDWVIVLMDRSRSMTIGDGAGGAAREAALRGAIEGALPTLAEMAGARRVVTMGFDAGVYELPVISEGAGALGEAAGRRTLLGRALDLALDSASARPVAGVVVLSDGASSDEPSRRALQRLRAERIPVFAVPLGSTRPVGDLSIARVQAPAAGFVGDRLPIRVEIERAGGDSGGGWLELVEASTGIVLDRRRVEGPEQGVPTLVATPREPGETAWRVRLVPDGEDILPENNEAGLSVRLVDRPLRVLHVDGYPRWEFRYLKNLFLREPLIASSSLLLATGRRHIQEGDATLDRLPLSPGEWEPFDVVVLGDLRADLLSDEQLSQLRDHVAERGAGLLWVAGPGATPGSWRGTVLESLLPFSVGAGVAAYAGDTVMRRSDEAARLGLLELDDEQAGGWPDRLSDPSTGWSLLRWSQRIEPERVKPTATVLATLSPADGSGPPTPGVLTMKFGAGRVVYVATDETWRWRYARGEELPERFWVPLVRLLGREGLARDGRGASLTAAPDRIELGATCVVEMTLLDARLVDAAPAGIRARVRDAEGRELASLELRPEGSPGEARRYTAQWAAPTAGEFTIESDDPVLAGERPTAGLVVIAPDDERQRVQTDHPRLAELAEATGGRLLGAEELALLPELLPNRERRVLGSPDVEPLWDSPLVLGLIMILLSLEWIGRRLVRLA